MVPAEATSLNPIRLIRETKVPQLEHVFRRTNAQHQAYHTALRQSAEEGNAPALFVIMLKREQDGGPCPDCEKPWRRVHSNPHPNVDFTWWDPDCGCFPRCRECGGSHHREIALDKPWAPCPSCGNAYTKQTRSLAEHGFEVLALPPIDEVLVPLGWDQAAP
jgi:DNA-directed RNA polymerase subunit M/transcription elongation factor TFIIS